MTDNYIEATEEYVKISRKNYDKIKAGYDSGYEESSDENRELIKSLQIKNDELESAICVVNYRKIIHDYGIGGRLDRNIGCEICNSESDFYEVAKKHINDIERTKERIENFQSSFIGKILNFFGIKI